MRIRAAAAVFVADAFDSFRDQLKSDHESSSQKQGSSLLVSTLGTRRHREKKGIFDKACLSERVGDRLDTSAAVRQSSRRTIRQEENHTGCKVSARLAVEYPLESAERYVQMKHKDPGLSSIQLARAAFDCVSPIWSRHGV